MDYENIRVGDVDIQVGFEWGSLGLHRYFPPGKGSPVAELDVGFGYTFSGAPCRPEYRNGKMSIHISDGDGTGYSLQDIFRHIGFLAGDVSKKYRFCHGAGLKVKGKGVLLIGKSGNGKTTLSSMIHGDLIDDDILLATPSEIRRISNVGGKTDNKRNMVEWLEDENRQSPLHYVFLLNNQYDPDHVVRIDPKSVLPESMFDNALHPSLLGYYKWRMPIHFKAPVFELGTKREPLETKKVIEEMASK